MARRRLILLVFHVGRKQVLSFSAAHGPYTVRQLERSGERICEELVASLQLRWPKQKFSYVKDKYDDGLWMVKSSRGVLRWVVEARRLWD
jgi:hypothetical protein